MVFLNEAVAKKGRVYVTTSQLECQETTQGLCVDDGVLVVYL